MKKLIVLVMAVTMVMMMFTACGSSEKSHTGHLARREPTKINLFDGSLGRFK